MKRIWVSLFSIAGPAAVMAAGSMGTGSTASLVLAGAWFQYSLGWVILLVIPPFVVALDSASRIGICGAKGMMSLISERLHPGVSWIILVIMTLVHILVAMGQISVMSAALLSAIGIDPPSGGAPDPSYRMAEVLCIALVSFSLLALLLRGGYPRVQKMLTGLLLLMLACFLVVAFRGFSDILLILRGLIPSIPEALPVPGSSVARSAGVSIIAIAGGVLAPASLLGMSYLTKDSQSSVSQFGRNLWMAIINLGLIFGCYSLFVLIAGGYALYPLSENAAIEQIHQAGQVLTRALPGNISFLAPRIFALGLFVCGLTTLVVIAQVMAYLTLDVLGKNWRHTQDNRLFSGLLAAWIVVPSILAPFWDFPALLKVLLIMGVNVVVAPLALAIILYLINSSTLMGAHRAGWVRNLFLVAGLLLGLVLAAIRLPGYLASL